MIVEMRGGAIERCVRGESNADVVAKSQKQSSVKPEVGGQITQGIGNPMRVCQHDIREVWNALLANGRTCSLLGLRAEQGVNESRTGLLRDIVVEIAGVVEDVRDGRGRCHAVGELRIV